jgi:hypothetical protein
MGNAGGDTCPELEVLGHFHDGALLMFQGHETKVTEALESQLTKVNALTLVYPSGDGR